MLSCRSIVLCEMFLAVSRNVCYHVADARSLRHELESPYVGLGRRKRKAPVPFFSDDKVNSVTPSWVRTALA